MTTSHRALREPNPAVRRQAVPQVGVVRIDRSHMARRASGIERITDDLFSGAALTPLGVSGTAASRGRLRMMVRQIIGNPTSAALHPTQLWVFPGYPPSPAFALMPERAVLYVHDLFLITRAHDLNRAARLYMAPLFRFAIRRLRHFLVNSQTTRDQLLPHVRRDAEVLLYRPAVRNVFGLRPRAGHSPPPETEPLIVGSLGTVEPRKNFVAAATICAALGRALRRPVELHIIGRPGWGDDFAILSRTPAVRLHGFLDDTAARDVIARFDLFLCTSHDEGLGLPLLEMQYGGMPIVAPDQPVFRETLADSGTFVDPAHADQAAAAIVALLANLDWRPRAAMAAAANLARWNAQAAADRINVVAFLAGLAGDRPGTPL
jgi:glycosyltransferase involved in cell wall biosynthesis